MRCPEQLREITVPGHSLSTRKQERVRRSASHLSDGGKRPKEEVCSAFTIKPVPAPRPLSRGGEGAGSAGGVTAPARTSASCSFA